MVSNIRTPAATDLFLLIEHDSRSVLFLNPIQIEEGELAQIQQTKSLLPSGLIYLLDPTLLIEERVKAEAMASALNFVLDTKDLELYSHGYFDNHHEPVLDVIVNTNRYFSAAIVSQWLISVCQGSSIKPDRTPLDLTLKRKVAGPNLLIPFHVSQLANLTAPLRVIVENSVEVLSQNSSEWCVENLENGLFGIKQTVFHML